MDKIWLRNYPAGIPAEIDPDLFHVHPGPAREDRRQVRRQAGVSQPRPYDSYAELERLSRDFAAFLQTLPGLASGERVAIMSPNVLQYPVALLGILRAGMAVVNVKPLYTPRELEHQLQDSGAKAIVILENFAHVLQQVLGKTPVEHVITTELGDLLPAPKRWLVNFVIKQVRKMVPAWRIDGAIGFREALARGAATSLRPVDVKREDVAFLQYTGGTTGVAKGAILTHRNILANLETDRRLDLRQFVEGTEIVIAPLPVYHILPDLDALVHEVGQSHRADHQPARLAGVRQGARTLEVERDDRRQHAVQRPHEYARIRPARFLHSEGGGRRRCSGAEAGGRALAADDRRLRHRSLRPDRRPRRAPARNPLGTPWNGSIGLPFPSTKVRSATTASTSCRRGPGRANREAHRGNMRSRPAGDEGVLEQPRGDRPRCCRDGWLKTGDVGHLDAEGYVTITDRKKDMILVSGFNVYPNEIESVIAMHPGVLECGAVGVPDDRSGEAVKVIVRKDPGSHRRRP